MSMAVGFNGARLHQKIFEERFHYWADKLGYLTSGEFYDFGMDWKKRPVYFKPTARMAGDCKKGFNHPSIIMWTPFNETIKGANADLEIHRRFIVLWTLLMLLILQGLYTVSVALYRYILIYIPITTTIRMVSY